MDAARESLRLVVDEAEGLEKLESSLERDLRDARLVEGLAPSIEPSRVDGRVVSFERKGKTESVEADVILVATGRTPNVENLGLEKAGIACHISLIPGLGGRSRSRLHAEKTAELLSQIHPASVWCIGLAIWEGTPLADMIRSGAFDPMDYREMLEELRYMVSLTEMEGPDCTFTDSSVLGLYTVEGKLPSGKADLLHVFDQLLAAYPVAPGEIRYDGPSVIG